MPISASADQRILSLFSNRLVKEFRRNLSIFSFNNVICILLCKSSKSQVVSAARICAHEKMVQWSWLAFVRRLSLIKWVTPEAKYAASAGLDEKLCAPDEGGGLGSKQKISRRNPWGNFSYADLITQVKNNELDVRKGILGFKLLTLCNLFTSAILTLSLVYEKKIGFLEWGNSFS